MLLELVVQIAIFSNFHYISEKHILSTFLKNSYSTIKLEEKKKTLHSDMYYI